MEDDDQRNSFKLSKIEGPIYGMHLLEPSVEDSISIYPIKRWINISNIVQAFVVNETRVLGVLPTSLQSFIHCT